MQDRGEIGDLPFGRLQIGALALAQFARGGVVVTPMEPIIQPMRIHEPGVLQSAGHYGVAMCFLPVEKHSRLQCEGVFERIALATNCSASLS